MKNILTMMISVILVLAFACAIAAQTKKSGGKSKERDLIQPDSVKKTNTSPSNSSSDEAEEPAAVEKPTNAKSSKKDSTQRKKVIAISNFFNAVTGNEEPQMGRQLVALFYSEFTRAGTYSVAATQQLEKILAEQDKTFDERMDARTAAKIGKIASANVFVFGDINEFNLTESEIEGGKYGSQNTFTATLGLTVSLVDVNTGVTLKSVNVKETAAKTSTQIKVFGQPLSKKLKMTPDLRNKLFTETANKAVKSAVEQLSPAIENKDSQVNAANNQIAETSIKKDAKTVAVANNNSTNRERSSAPKESARVVRMIKDIAFISGLGQSAKIGDILSVVRDGREIAVLEITEVNENTAKAKVIEGAGIKANDTVKIIQ